MNVCKLWKFVGLGMNNVIGIKVDSRGKMMIEDLVNQIEKCIDKGQDPFMVAATAGISKICIK